MKVDALSPSLLRLEKLTRAGIGPVDLTLEAGDCLAITGRSGAGKSLLLRMIADLDPHKGEAWLKGGPRGAMTGPQWRRRVTYCAAEAGWWHQTVAPHFSSPPFALAAELGLGQEIFEQEVRLCSSGERQRLSLLRSLLHGPEILLLDEPTGALDPESVARVETIMAARRQNGTAMIWVTHDPAQARRVGSRHMVMDGGRLTL